MVIAHVGRASDVGDDARVGVSMRGFDRGACDRARGVVVTTTGRLDGVERAWGGGMGGGARGGRSGRGRGGSDVGWGRDAGGGGGGTRARATTGRVRVGAAGRAGCRSSASWGGRVGECVVRGRWCAL